MFETSIERTVGWHEFRLEVTSSETNAFIDGTLVGSSPITMYEFFFLVNDNPVSYPKVYWDDICIFNGDGASCFQTNVNIDIKPFSKKNRIRPNSRRLIPVSILGSGDFDALQTIISTVRFGPDGANAIQWLYFAHDINGDGFTDLTLFFKTRKTGIQCGDTEAKVMGETHLDVTFEGTDSIKTVHCP